MRTQIEELPDGTKFYNFDELESFLSGIKEKGEKPLLTEDLVLILLYARADRPIYGKTMLMKEVFLMCEEILKPEGVRTQDPRFVPYKYGPYSFNVMQTLETMVVANLIASSGKRNSRKEAFILTGIGVKRAEQKFERLPADVRESLESLRVGWDQLGTHGILQYVYQKYERYKAESEIKSRYKDIIWGRGKA